MRFQLAILNDARDDSREQDSWGVNCFVEKEAELRAVKRPGLAKTVDVVGSGTVGQGIFIWPDYTGLNPKIVTIWDDALWIYESDYTLDLGWDLTTAGSGTDVSLMGWSDIAPYNYDDKIWYDDGTGTGNLTKFYARSATGSHLLPPVNSGWQQYLWGDTKLNTTDRWRHEILNPYGGEGNTANAAGASYLAAGVPDTLGNPSFPASGIDGVGRSWTEGIATSDELPTFYSTVLIAVANPPFDGYTAIIPRNMGSYTKTA